ncbi:MAG: cobalamin adenosyltransferase [Reinekea sp.]|nr:cobalamin adenosyltransferase [Reinekea sp.]
MFKFNGDIDEMSYPFIYETSTLCDFEILTDELCTQVGLAGSACMERDTDLQQVLFEIQPKMFDLNGSIRGRCAIGDAELDELKSIYSQLKQLLVADDRKFVLPRGTGAVVPLHYCRSLSKKVTRLLVRLDQDGVSVPPTLPRYTNVLTNLFFVVTRIINQRSAVEEPEYISSNYGKARLSRVENP